MGDHLFEMAIVVAALGAVDLPAEFFDAGERGGVGSEGGGDG